MTDRTQDEDPYLFEDDDPFILLEEPPEELPAGHSQPVLAELDTSVWMPAEFWETRPALVQIARVANARGLSRDAVLGSVLARVCSLMPHTLVLPPIDGAPASLNFFAVSVAESGDGKSAANRVATELVPSSVLDHQRVHEAPSLGSAEGLVEQFFDWCEEEDENGKKMRVKKLKHQSLFVRVDEATRLTELAGRKGSTMLSTLLAIWSGENPGTTGASEETTRNLPAMRYRAGVVVNYQPSVAKELRKQAGIGLPQRFVVFNASPRRHLLPPSERERIDNPGPIKWAHRPVTAGANGTAPQIEVPDEIRLEVQQDRYERQMGMKADNDGLGGHATLSRLKLAALFGALDGRWSINAEDWELARTVMTVSHRNWQTISDLEITEQRRKEQANATRKAAEAIAAEDALATRHQSILHKAFGSMARKANKQPDASKSEVFKAINGSYRAELRKAGLTQSEVIELAIEEGVFTVDDTSSWKVDHDWLI